MAEGSARGSTAVEASPHVRKKRKRRRQEILHAALRAFRDKGYHGTSLGDIAGRLGLQKTALYHYFPDKEAILYACHRRFLDELEKGLEDARLAPDARSQSQTERLAHLIREHVRVMRDVLHGSPLPFEVGALSPDHRADVTARRQRYEGELRRIVSQGVASGEFRPVDPDMAVLTILGAADSMAARHGPGRKALPPAEREARLAAHLVGGLASARARSAPSTPENGVERP